MNRTGTEWVSCMLQRRTTERNLDILDTSCFFGWLKYQLKPPNTKKYLTEYHESILSGDKTYPKVVSDDVNPCIIVTIECEFCQKIHRVRMYCNGVSWQQVTNKNACPYGQKCQRILPKCQDSLPKCQDSPLKCQNIIPKMISPNKYYPQDDFTKLVSILSPISSYDMDDNTRLDDITFILLNDENPMENPIAKEKWDETRINNDKNTRRVGLLHNVLHGIRDVNTKQTYHVTFNKSVQLKSIPGRHHYNQRHVTFTSHVMVTIIPSNHGISTQK